LEKRGVVVHDHHGLTHSQIVAGRRGVFIRASTETKSGDCTDAQQCSRRDALFRSPARMEMIMSMTLAPSQTIADLLPQAVERHGERVALRHRIAEGWRDIDYAELAENVRAIALGFVDLGVAPGDRVAILANTRPEWTYADLAITAAAAVVVPVYPTNSIEECEWVLRDSGAVAVICEDASQVAKVQAARAQLPRLKTIFAIDKAPGAIGLAELIERGGRRDPAELDRRTHGVVSADPYTFIYTSGTTGPPKGCVLTHGNFRAVLDAVRAHDLLAKRDDLTYLYLPLAHALALIMQLATLEAGGAIAYFDGDTQQIPAELAEVSPTFLPSVPRIFEKVYAAVTRDIGPMVLRDATRIGSAVEDLRLHGLPVPPELRDAYDQFDELLFKRVRAAFGGRLRLAITGAAPIAPETLELSS
jgi:long-chain acyl-CoA synthetase